MAQFWCVNFDAEEVLLHGLQENFWAMQYQYTHGGHVYQGRPNQLHSTTKHLRAVVEIEAGDWLVAYLKPKTFYAVGEVIEPLAPRAATTQSSTTYRCPGTVTTNMPATTTGGSISTTAGRSSR